MNLSLVCISIFLKNNTYKPSLIKFLNEVSSKSLRNYVKLANIYDGGANEKKSDLIEMIIYRHIKCKLDNKNIDDISTNKAHSILKEKDINIKLLSGYDNMGKRKKDINQCTENNKCSVKIDG